MSYFIFWGKAVPWRYVDVVAFFRVGAIVLCARHVFWKRSVFVWRLTNIYLGRPFGHFLGPWAFVLLVSDFDLA